MDSGLEIVGADGEVEELGKVFGSERERIELMLCQHWQWDPFSMLGDAVVSAGATKPV